MKMAIFWVVAPLSLVEIYRRFRGACCLHPQGDRQTITEHLHDLVNSDCVKCGEFLDYLERLTLSLPTSIATHGMLNTTEIQEAPWLSEGGYVYRVSAQCVRCFNDTSV
jgi:hypothetical protein